MAIEKTDRIEGNALRAAAKGRDDGPERTGSAPGADREGEGSRAPGTSPTWTVEFDPSIDCVEYIYDGPVSGADLRRSTSRGIELGKTHGFHRYLVDTRKMVFAASPVDLMELAEKQYVEEGLDRRSRIAALIAPTGEARKMAEFYRTCSVNRGWIVKVFQDRSEAIRWLRGKPEDARA